MNAPQPNKNINSSLDKEVKKLRKQVKSANSQKAFAYFLSVLLIGVIAYGYFVLFDQSAVSELDAQFKKLQQENSELIDELAEMQARSEAPQGSIGLNAASTVYSVQFRSLTNRVPLVSSQFIAIKGFESTKLFSYSAGVFATEKEAVLLRDELEKLGFKDAFIVAVQNGDKTMLKDLRR